MANEIVKSFGEMLTDKIDSVDSALPCEFNKARFVQNALTVLNENQNLAKINKAQLIQGLMKGAYLGLDFMSKECYLIPYGQTVQFQTSYKGEIKFVKKYSIRKIKDITSFIVREGDIFSADIIDNNPVVNFKPVQFSQAKIVGVFAIVYFEDGGVLYETMTTEDVNNVRKNYSKMPNAKTWQNSWDEMARKTCLRRLCKHIECDFETVEARNSWDDGSDANFVGQKVTAARSDEDVIDVFAEEVEADE